MERRRRGRKSRVARLDAVAELNLPRPGTVTLVLRLILLLILLLILTTPSPAPAGGVRVPRDSSSVIHHRVEQPSSFAPPAPAPERAPSTHACATHVFPDPGYRPLWVPGSSCWNGAQAVWVPGHWIWSGPEWPLRAPGFSASNPPAIPLAP